jgi:hypothetical protein
MKKVVRLTESDLVRIVKRVIKEQSSTFYDYLNTKGYEIVNDCKNKFSDGVEMLSFLHINNHIKKMNTNDVTVVYGPGNDGRISLDQLNEMIAKDMNLSLQELSLRDAPKIAKNKKK